MLTITITAEPTPELWASLNNLLAEHPSARMEMQNSSAAPPKQVPLRLKNKGPAKPEKPKEPTVYDRLIGPWEAAGGNRLWSAPPGVVNYIGRIATKTLDGKGNERPIRTLEFGSGLSTLVFAERGIHHTAIEHDAKFVEIMLSQIKGDTVQIIHAPLKDGWYDWEPIYGTLYDFIVIDGPPGGSDGKGRSLAPEKVKHLLAPGGIIVVDDTHRKAEQEVAETLAATLGLNRKRWKETDPDRAFDVLRAPTEPLGEGPGTNFHEFLSGLPGVQSCQACYDLAVRMNQWGPDGCRENLAVIVDDVLPRAMRWWGAATPWMRADAFFKSQPGVWNKLKAIKERASLVNAKAAFLAPDTAEVQQLLRDVIREHVTKAIDKCSQ